MGFKNQQVDPSGLSTLYIGRLRVLATEMYKVINNLAPSYVSDLFQKRENMYNIRIKDNLEIPRYKSVRYGKNSITYFGPKIWNGLPSEIKQSVTINEVKHLLKLWNGPMCKCNLCKLMKVR